MGASSRSSSAAVEVTPASRFPVRGNTVSPAGHVSPRTRFSGSRGSRRELRRGEGSSQAPAQGKAATARRRGREMPPWGPAWAAPLSLAHAPSPPPPRAACSQLQRHVSGLSHGKQPKVFSILRFVCAYHVHPRLSVGTHTALDGTKNPLE